MTKKKSPKLFYGYVVVLSAFIIKMIMWGVMYSFGVFLKPLSAEFGWTSAAISGAYSLTVVLHGLLSILAGRLTDKFGPRMVMTVSGFLFGAGFLLMSQVSALWQLYLFCGVIVGIAMSAVYVPLVSTAARWFVKRRGLMTGFVVSGVGAGTIIMPPVANWLISAFGWSTSFFFIGIVALVSIILAAQFLRRDPTQVGQLPYGGGEARESSLQAESGGFSFGRAIRTRQFWIFYGVVLCFGFYIQSVMVHIVPHAIELGISAATAAIILSIVGGVSIAGRIMMGGAGDRMSNKPAAVIAAILISVALFWLLGAREVWMLCLFAAVFGFGYGGFGTLFSPIVADLFGLGSHGMILGAVTTGGTIGGAIGPVLSGRIFDVSGSYNQAFLICAVIAVIGLVLVSVLKPIK